MNAVSIIEGHPGRLALLEFFTVCAFDRFERKARKQAIRGSELVTHRRVGELGTVVLVWEHTSCGGPEVSIVLWRTVVLRDHATRAITTSNSLFLSTFGTSFSSHNTSYKFHLMHTMNFILKNTFFEFFARVTEAHGCD